MAEYKKGVESFYGGGGSSFDPQSGKPYVGFRLNPAQIGFSTNPTTGDQLSETMRGIRAGAKVIEVNLLRIGIQGGGDSDQVIPQQHFAEIRALTKLTGVKPSIHGPLVDAAGFEGQGNWSEEQRENNERIMFAAMQKAKWADPGQNIPVIFHSSNMLGAGTHYTPGDVKKGEKRFKEEIVPVFDRTQKRIIPINEREYYRLGGIPGDKKNPFKITQSPEDTIESQNNTAWSNSMQELTLGKRYVDEAIDKTLQEAEKVDLVLSNPNLDEQKKKEVINNFQNKFSRAYNLYGNNHSKFNNMYGEAYEYGTEEQKKVLSDFSKKYNEERERIQKSIKEEAEKGNQNPYKEFEYLKSLSELDDQFYGILDNVTKGDSPKNWIKAEEFAMEQAAKSFGNVAAKTYKELGGDKAPRVSIENVWNGAFFARGKDMKELILKSREEMVKNLTKDGMDEKKAKEVAEKQIGMNFDVGHMNMFRKKGFETKDILGEVEEFAPLINHMHITDNFGFSDEHLFPGQGNVPLKEMLEIVKKKHKDIDSFKKIVETGGFEARHNRGVSVHNMNLAAFGVPIFGGSSGTYSNAPTFDASLNTFGAYSAGFGLINPDIHHSLYGAGFSNLPPELGGQIPGMQGRSRFGGAPMS